MDYGLKITGNVRVFCKTKKVENKEKKISYDVTDYWINVSEKMDDGTYDNKSINLFFKRGEPVPTNNTIMSIYDAWFFLTGSGKYKKVSIFVKDWDYENVGGEEEEKK